MADIPEIPPRPGRIVRHAIDHVEGFATDAYWDGHNLADGHPATPDPVRSDRAARHEAMVALIRYAEAGHTEPPAPLGDVIRPGETFNAADYPPGTLFRMFRESLAAPERALPIRLQSRRPAVYTPTPVEGEETIEGNGWVYTNTSTWLLSGETAGRKMMAFGASAGAAVLQGGEVKYSGSFWQEASEVEVGAVSHYVLTAEGITAQAMRRTLLIYRCNIAAPRTSRVVKVAINAMHALHEAMRPRSKD